MPARAHRAGQRPDVGSGGEVHRLAGRRPQPQSVEDGGLADGGQHHQTLQRGTNNSVASHMCCVTTLINLVHPLEPTDVNACFFFFQCGGTTHVLRLSWSPDGQYLVSAHAMNNSGPTAQIVERDGWKTNMDFVGHRKAVTVVVSDSRTRILPCEMSQFHLRTCVFTLPSACHPRNSTQRSLRRSRRTAAPRSPAVRTAAAPSAAKTDRSPSG